MKRNNPGLLKERTSPKHNVKKWDRAILRSYTVCLVCMLACCGLDAVRFQWSNMPLWLRISGFLCLVPPAVIAFRVFKVNSFLSSVVRLQKDRAQKVVQAGPYRFVRHPLYTSVILMVIFTPLALGSFYALLISGLIIALFFLRTHLEDRTLKKELPGYKKYARKVRYRLIPGVW
jgi:protein-S-isoprenylcysteine O-methyltransferase Ste14